MLTIELFTFFLKYHPMGTKIHWKKEKKYAISSLDASRNFATRRHLSKLINNIGHVI